jgi:hypothetical protein
VTKTDMGAICVHFNGIQNQTCQAGVEYSRVLRPLNEDEAKRAADFEARYGGISDFASGKRIPCFRENGCDLCPMRRYPTAEEIEADEARWVERSKAYMHVHSAIREKHGKWKRGAGGFSDSMPCPACGQGTLYYARAAVNGHTRGHCTTKGCVAWMQ